MKLSSWYFVQLQRFNPLRKFVFDVAKTLDVKKVSLIMVDSKAYLASVSVFRKELNQIIIIEFILLVFVEINEKCSDDIVDCD